MTPPTRNRRVRGIDCAAGIGNHAIGPGTIRRYQSLDDLQPDQRPVTADLNPRAWLPRLASPRTWREMVLGMIPQSPVQVMADVNVLPLIVFSLLIGIGRKCGVIFDNRLRMSPTFQSRV